MLRRARRGYTLVELAVTLSLVAFLAMLAAPSYQKWIRNARVRGAAESLTAGLRYAQAEALRRHRQTVFTLTREAPGLDSSAAADGPNWAVHSVPLAGEERELLQGATAGAAGAGVRVSSARAALCFNSSGRQAVNPHPGPPGADCAIDGAAPRASYDIAADGADRPLRVTVELGGQIRLCDPKRTLSVAQPDGCPR